MRGFQTCTIGGLGIVTTGKTPPTVDAGNFGGNIPFVTPTDMTDGRYIEKTNRYLTDDGLKTVARQPLPAGVIMVSCIGSDMGKTFIARVPCYSNQQINSLEVTVDGVDPLFIYYNLFGRKSELQRLAAGSSAQPILNKANFTLVPVELPPLADQKAIASTLGSLDDKIELNRRMNETLEAMAQAIFRDWFVDFGPTRRKLAGVADSIEIMGGLVQDPTRATELAELFPATFGDNGLPEGWENEALISQAEWVNGAAYKNMHFCDALDALPVIKIAELKAGVTATTMRTNSQLGERYRIKDGELLFSWSGNPDTSIDTFVWTGGDAWLNQHIFAVRENGKRSAAYLHTLLRYLRPEFAELARNKQTTGLGHVTKENMSRLFITQPTPALSVWFDLIVGPIHGRFRSTLFENQTLAATRDLLLPKLMSGEIRLRDAEKIVGDSV